jgi:hypothetical protein
VGRQKGDRCGEDQKKEGMKRLACLLLFCGVVCAQGSAGAKPEAKDFDTYEAYMESLADWKIAHARIDHTPAPMSEFQGWVAIGELGVISFLIYTRGDRTNRYLEDFASRLRK